MQLLENFDEIESASDAELERLLWLSARKNRRGRLDKRILRIREEIKRRKNSEYIMTDKGAFTLKYDCKLFNTTMQFFLARDLACIAIEDNTDPARLNGEVQEAVRRFYTGVSVEPNPELDRMIKEERDRRKEEEAKIND